MAVQAQDELSGVVKQYAMYLRTSAVWRPRQ